MRSVRLDSVVLLPFERIAALGTWAPCGRPLLKARMSTFGLLREIRTIHRS